MHIPCSAWFEVLGGGVESRQLLLDKVKALEDENTWLRAKVEKLVEKKEERETRHLVFELG